MRHFKEKYFFCGGRVDDIPMKFRAKIRVFSRMQIACYLFLALHFTTVQANVSNTTGVLYFDTQSNGSSEMSLVVQKSSNDSVEYASAPGQAVDLPDMSKEQSVRAEQHDKLLDQWLKEHASNSSKRQVAMEQRLRDLMKDHTGKPSPLVLRYHFDAPFGYLEANAAGSLHPARIWRAGRQQLGPKREAGVFGLALRHGSRAAADTSFPADKSFTVSFWIHADQSEARSIFNGKVLSV